MVFHDRPVYQEEHAAQLIMARRLHSPHKGRIHLRRSVDPLFAFPLHSDGGPYIFRNYDVEFESSFGRITLDLRTILKFKIMLPFILLRCNAGHEVATG